MPALGISKEDEDTLINEVSVVFHSAATVRFDEELAKAVQMNLEGTRLIVELSRRMINLTAIVHVSTAYCHCYLENIEEKFYPCPGACPETITAACRAAEGSENLQKAFNHPDCVKEVIGSHPNTYAFTKALAEQWLFQSATDLPLAIVRPSIVIAAWKDPFPGWIDNFNGPTGLIIQAASGILRSIVVDSKSRADFIPVDVVINLMCVVAAKLGNNSIERKGSIPVYNCTSGALNPVTWAEFKEKIFDGFASYPMKVMLWYPGLTFHTIQWFHTVCHILMHKLPAVVLDFFVYLAGHRPFQMRMIDRMEKASGVINFFANKEWNWDSNNIMELEKTLSPKEKEVFELDITKLDWNDYMKWYAYGCRHYVMKSDPLSVKSSLRQAGFMRKVHQMFVICLVFGLISLFLMLLPFKLPGQLIVTGIVSFVTMMLMVNPM